MAEPTAQEIFSLNISSGKYLRSISFKYIPGTLLNSNNWIKYVTGTVLGTEGSDEYNQNLFMQFTVSCYSCTLTLLFF